MKWREKPTFQKIVVILAIVCGVAHFTLEILALLDVCQIHGAVSRVCFGTSWLCLGVLYTEKKISILYYIVAALWFLSGVLRIIV